MLADSHINFNCSFWLKFLNTVQDNDISNQQDAAKFVLLILLSLLYMFRRTVSPIFRNTLSVHTAFWDNVPTLLSAADR